MTLKEFREFTKDVPETAKLYYHAYDKGCCLGGFIAADIWLFPKDQLPVRGIVLNPGEDYDPRRPAEKI